MSDARAEARWDDILLAAALYAVDPPATGGIAIRAAAGPARDHLLDVLRALLPAAAPFRRLPLHISDSRLLGGLDLAATLRAGKPIAERGALAESDGGTLVLAMAERLSASTVAKLCAVLDDGEVRLERDGLTLRNPARVGLIALDEGIDADEAPAAALLDRLAFRLDLGGLRPTAAAPPMFSAAQVEQARARLDQVRPNPEVDEALCAAALALGIESIRAVILALRVARAAAALAGRDEINEIDAAVAGRLVLAPLATRLPAPPPAEESDGEPPPAEPPMAEANADAEPEPPPPPGEIEPPPPQATDDERPVAQAALDDVVLEAARAAIPPGLLAQLQLAALTASRAGVGGKSGAVRQSSARGRPAGVRRGEPRAGARLNVIETLRAAAPWQRLRRQQRAPAADGSGAAPSPRVEIRREDFHVTRYQQRSETTTIFVVDASGSSALNRLAEAKGAVELLLADCYVRRDRVAVIGFRGRSAELLLPPTRSLLRAKRSLAGLPGGGGTPLATALDAAVALADSLRRRGETPCIVVLTDGAANVARDGSGGRSQAEADAIAAAQQLRGAGFSALFIDTAPRPQPFGRTIATHMGARYLPLPYADARALSSAVKAVSASPAGTGRISP